MLRAELLLLWRPTSSQKLPQHADRVEGACHSSTNCDDDTVQEAMPVRQSDALDNRPGEVLCSVDELDVNLEKGAASEPEAVPMGQARPVAQPRADQTHHTKQQRPMHRVIRIGLNAARAGPMGSGARPVPVELCWQRSRVGLARLGRGTAHLCLDERGLTRHSCVLFAGHRNREVDVSIVRCPKPRFHDLAEPTG